jgi:phage shock protein PspC (stress-responsive transcriptional regulator)
MDILRKLSSRKLWAAAAGVVTGLAILFGLDESIITTVGGSLVSVVSVVTYIVTEGKIDAAAVGDAAQAVQDALEAVTQEEHDEDL